MTPDEFRTIRKGLGLSQAALAERLGYRARVTVTEIEGGRCGITKALALLMIAYRDGYVPHAATPSDRAD